MARQKRRGAPRMAARPPLVIATLTVALALTACSWAPVNWVATHTPPSLKREARAVFDAATSSESAPATATTDIVAPELPLVPGAPDAFQLSTSGDASVAEPGAGIDANFPLAATSGAFDDAQRGYWDPYYATLCGPGAVSVALYYWRPTHGGDAPPSVADPLMDGAATRWSDTDIDGVYRMRGSMLRLAFQIRPPGWRQAGMLPQSTWQSGELGGATLQVVRDALNWEASGENARDWSRYFYTTQWNSAYYTNRRLYPLNLYSALHTDIVSDLAFHHVPVIVEITAGYLPNWRDTNPVNHFVAITGYDDAAGTYTYLDTCKVYTGCDTAGGMDAPGRHTIDQLQLSAAVANIGASPATGDGGWVW